MFRSRFGSLTLALFFLGLAPRARAASRVEWSRSIWRHGRSLPYLQASDSFVVSGSRSQVARGLEKGLAGTGLRVVEILSLPRLAVNVVRLGPQDRLPRTEAAWRRMTSKLVSAGGFSWVGPVFFSGTATTLTTGRFWVFVDKAKATSAFWAAKGLRFVRWIHAASSVALVEPARTCPDLLAFADRLVSSGLDATPELAIRLYPRIFPTDTYFDLQWTMWNTGDNVTDAFTGQPLRATAMADIRAADAWDIETGSADIIVGVIDTGVDCTHPDLSPKCLDGLDAIRNQPDASPPDPSTDFGAGHGTSVSSIAAGAMDGAGVVGVCPDCSVVPVRLIETNTFLSDEMMLRAFTFAVDSGAAVINNSWGPQGAGYYVPMPTGVYEGLQYALQQGRGGLGTVVVFAAGNDNQSTSLDGELGSGLANVMAVAASDQFDLKSEYSNYGPEVSVCAPTSDEFLGPAVYAAEIRGNGNVAGDYTSMFGGTSAAAPMVSGVAALVIAADPTLTAAEVVELLEETADKVDPDGGRYDGNGHSIKYGYGRVNALRALRRATGQVEMDWCNPPAAQEDCGTHRDDNCDGFVDEGCTTNDQVGQPCNQPGDCGPQQYWSCPNSGKSQGLCTLPCNIYPCPAGTACVEGDCIRECASNDECQDGFVCTNDELGWCVPACAGDQDCGEGEFCDPNTSLCKLATDGQIGSPCNENADCQVPGGFCLSDMMGFEDGYCTMSCNTDQDCGGTNRCVFIADHGSFCYKGCSLDGDCRPNYVCEQSGPRAGTCYKLCSRDDQCTGGDPNWEGIVCETDTGRCIDTREPDAGVPDAAVDAAPEVDAGLVDAAPDQDASGTADAGNTPDGKSDSGCDCSASGAAGSSPVWILFGLLGLALLRRRR